MSASSAKQPKWHVRLHHKNATQWSADLKSADHCVAAVRVLLTCAADQRAKFSAPALRATRSQSIALAQLPALNHPPHAARRTLHPLKPPPSVGMSSMEKP